MARNGNAPTTTPTDKRGGKSMTDDKDAAKEAKAAAQAVAGVNEPAITQYVRLDEINVDETRNVRQDYGPESPEAQGSIALLAQDIVDNGQQTPVMVARNPKGGYDLIAGFRRMRALRHIEAETKAGKRTGVDPVLAWVQIRKPETEVDALYLNWGENLQRKDLTPYENAREAALLVKDHGQKAGDIAARVKLDRKYVDNLIRAYNSLDPRIRELWARGHARATWSFIIGTKGFLNSSHAEQWQTWREHIGEIDAEGNPVVDAASKDDSASDDGEGEGTTNADASISRPSVVKLEQAMRYVRDCDKPEQWKKGALAALSFAAGLSERIPAVYDPKKAAEAEKAEKAAEREAEREAAKAAKAAETAKGKAAKGGRPNATA